MLASASAEPLPWAFSPTGKPVVIFRALQSQALAAASNTSSSKKALSNATTLGALGAVLAGMEAQELLSQADETVVFQGCDQPCYRGLLPLGLDKSEKHLIGLFVQSLSVIFEGQVIDDRIAQGPAGLLQRATHLLPFLRHELGKFLVVVRCEHPVG